MPSRETPGARLFVALELPAEVRARLAAHAAGSARADPALRALPAEALHLTLCFLGSRPASEIDAIAAALARCAGPAPTLGLGALEWLPRRRPRVLAVSVADPDGSAAALQRRVARTLAAGIRYRPERRPFHPHVTLARVRGSERPALAAVAAAEPDPPSDVFACAGLALFRSHLGGGPARYEVLARVELSRA